MTCVVGLEHQGKVYIGADSMGADGWNQLTCSSPKVFRNGEFLIGYTTSFRMGQILQYHLKVDPQPDHMQDEEYMVVVFVEAVREILKQKGFSEVDRNKENGGNFLVGYRGKLYEVTGDFQISRWSEGLNACGCARDYARAALKALEVLEPITRIGKALEIAEYFSNGVKPPFHIEVLE